MLPTQPGGNGGWGIGRGPEAQRRGGERAELWDRGFCIEQLYDNGRPIVVKLLSYVQSLFRYDEGDKSAASTPPA